MDTERTWLQNLLPKALHACAVGLLVTGQTAAADWPTWRGPFGNGSAADCAQPLDPDLTKARLVWKSSDVILSSWGYPGKQSWLGFGSPVIADGRVFIALPEGDGEQIDPARKTAVEEMRAKIGDLKRFLTDELVAKVSCIDVGDVVYGLDAKTGETLWRRAWPKRGMNCWTENGSGHHHLVYGVGTVFGVGVAGHVFALDAASGEVRWEARPFADLGDITKMEAEWAKAKASGSVPGRGVGSGWLTEAPVHADGVVVFGGGGRLVAYDAASGKELWRQDGLLGRWTSPLIWRNGGTAQVLCAKENLTLLDLRSGRPVWQQTCIATVATPALSGEVVVLRTDEGQGTVAAYRLSAAGAQELWRWSGKPQSPGQSNSPVIHHGRVYLNVKTPGGDAVSKYFWLCLDLATGTQLGLAPCVDFAPKAWASAVASNGILFISPHNASGRKCLAIIADPADFKVLKPVPFPVDGCNSTSLAIVDGRLYSRGLDGIYCHDLRQQDR
jgi:outer membrane protein assembly factor BamB